MVSAPAKTFDVPITLLFIHIYIYTCGEIHIKMAAIFNRNKN